MSLQAMTWVFNEAPVTDPSTLLVLLALADHADRDGRNAFPSRETIAAYARLSVRSVSVKLAALQESGIITLGDQQKVAHFPSGRRPKVYDISIGVQNLHPTGSGYERPVTERLESVRGVQGASPLRGEEGFTGGVQDTTERGEAHGTSGVKPTAHKPKLLNPKRRTSSGEVTTEEEACPHGYHPTSCGHCTTPAVLEQQESPHWRPSPAALAEAKASVRITDINLSIASYAVWCKRHGRQMSNGEWLTWILRDEKAAVEERRKEAAARVQRRGWASVED